MAMKVANKRIPKTRTPISAANMGKALVLLATTCAALSTRRHTPTKRGFEVSTNKSVGSRTDRITVLHYRDLDELDAMNAESVSDALTEVRVSTPTLHRAIAPESQPMTDEQIVMDEYLEYVERRYSRMHRPKSTDKAVVQPSLFSPGKFMLSTLVYSSRTPSPTSHSAAENEALRALGLTSLASERLRQRLQAPREFRSEHESAINFLQYFAKVDKLAMSATEASGGRLSPHVGLSFLAQWKLLLHSLGKILMSYVTSIRIMAHWAVRVVPAILERGGLRRSVRLLSVASVAILLLFRPLLRGFVKRA